MYISTVTQQSNKNYPNNTLNATTWDTQAVTTTRRIQINIFGMEDLLFTRKATDIKQTESC